MPLYEYKCENCDHLFEYLQGFHEKDVDKCPKCCKMKLTRQMGSGVRPLFRGTGFYETDYKNKN